MTLSGAIASASLLLLLGHGLYGQRFDVTDFGADGSDDLLDTPAINAALSAAVAAGGGEVYFPKGTYQVSPPGTVAGFLWHFTGGQWRELGPLPSALEGVNWTWGSMDGNTPIPSEGHLDAETGRIWQFLDGEWRSAGMVLDGQGETWRSGWDPPEDSAGSEGILYFQYRIDFQNLNAAVFELNESHSGISFKGVPELGSRILFRSWAGEDPNDYEVDTEERIVLNSRIPRDRAGNYVRGSLFALRPTAGAFIDSIEWRNLVLDGGTKTTGKNSWYTPYDDLEEWDISHKGIVFGFGGSDMGTFVVENCELGNWRGEILYKGGANAAEILVMDSEIYGSNASAVSISGTLTLIGCTIHTVYNGVENYLHAGQANYIDNCYFDLSPRETHSGGDWGVVLLGEKGSQATVSQSEFHNASKGGLFLSEFANSITIRDNIIRGVPWGIYAFYINLYPPVSSFDDITIERNQFIAANADMSFAILSSFDGPVGRNWIIRDNRTSGVEGHVVFCFFNDNHTGGLEARNVLIEGNIIDSIEFVRTKGAVPRMMDNIFLGPSKTRQLNLYRNSGSFSFTAVHPRTEVTFVPPEGLVMEINDIERYAVGHEFTLKNAREDVTLKLEINPAEWNNLQRGYLLVDGAEASFIKGADGRFHLTEFKERWTEPAVSKTAGPTIDFRGRSFLDLQPDEPGTYSLVSGLPSNVVVGLRTNEQVIFSEAGGIDLNGVPSNPGNTQLSAVRTLSETVEISPGETLSLTSTSLRVAPDEPFAMSLGGTAIDRLPVEWFQGAKGDTRNLQATSPLLTMAEGLPVGRYSFWGRALFDEAYLESGPVDVLSLPEETWIRPFDIREAVSQNRIVYDRVKRSAMESSLLSGSRVGGEPFLESGGSDLLAEFEIFMNLPDAVTRLWFPLRLSGRGQAFSLGLLDDFSGSEWTLQFFPDGNGGGWLRSTGAGGAVRLNTDLWYGVSITYIPESTEWQYRVEDLAARTWLPVIQLETGGDEETSFPVSDRVIATLAAEATFSARDSLHLGTLFSAYSPGAPARPIPVSPWASVGAELDGLKATSLGLLWDALYPWVLHVPSGQWLYILDTASTESSAYALLYKEDEWGWIWFTEQAADWYYHFSDGEWQLFQLP